VKFIPKLNDDGLAS